jgi:hypothetical protein
MPPALFALVIFQVESCVFDQDWPWTTILSMPPS